MKKKSFIIIALFIYAGILLRCINTAQPVPSYARFHYEKGLKLENSGRLNKALRAYQEALHHNPSHARSNYRIGRIYSAMGNYSAMIDYYTRAVDFGFNEDVDAFYELGMYCLRQRRLSEAKMYFLRTLKHIGVYKNEEERELMAKSDYGLAQVYLAEDDILKAKPHLEKAVNYNMDWREAQVQLAQILVRTGERQELIVRIIRLRHAGREALAEALETRYLDKMKK